MCLNNVYDVKCLQSYRHFRLLFWHFYGKILEGLTADYNTLMFHYALLHIGYNDKMLKTAFPFSFD